MPEFKLFRFKAYGRVQGVGFRAFVQKLGRSHQVGGWVKNNADGSVSVEVRGNDNQISAFVADVKKGSFFSRVDEIEELSNEKIAELPLPVFEIRF